MQREKFEPFIGEWKTAGKHPLLPGTVLRGHVSFTWIEGGAFLRMHSEIEGEGIPTGVAIFGGDDGSGEILMLYYDDRNVSRIYRVSIEGNVMQWRRDEPGFLQRVVLTIAEDGHSIDGKSELCRDGRTWEKDLELAYIRV